MMCFKNLLIVCLSLTLLFLSGCNDDPGKGVVDSKTQKEDFYTDIGDWKVPIPVLPGKKKKHIARPAVQVVNNKMAVLYSTPKKIVFSYNNNETVIEEKGGAKQLWLFKNKKNNNLYAFWWKKTKNGKRLYFRGTSDLGKTFSKRVIVNSSGGVLPTIDFVSDDKGNLTVAYYDERKPPYQIYINTSSDNGKTWRENDVRIDNDENVRTKKVGDKELPMAYAINPLLSAFNDGKLLIVWQQLKMVDGRVHMQFASRTSTDHGKTWDKEQIIYTANENYPVESALANNGTEAVLVGAFSTTSGLLALSAKNNSAQQKLEWSEIGFAPGTAKVNEVSVLKSAISKTNFKVAYAIKKKQTTKYHVEIASIDLSNNLNKRQWGKKAFRLDRGKKQPVEMQATYHDLKVLPNGEFVVVWQDYRRLIPMLMLDYTSNSGKKWQKEPIAMTRGGLSAIKFPAILVDSDTVWLVFEWYVYGGKKLPRLSFIQIPVDSKSGKLKVVVAPKPKQISLKDLKSKLKNKAIKLMDLRVKKEWEKTWDFMDPVYRLVTDKRSWLSRMGYIVYDDYKITDVKVDGIFATVEMDVTVSLRQQFRNDQIMEPSPPKKTHTTTKWLYFYDQWYFYPESSFTPHLKY